MIKIVDKKLIIKKKRNIHFIPIKEVLYFEKFNHKTYVHLENKNEISLNMSLKELEIILPSNFKRTHRSFLINKELLEGLIFLNEKSYEAIFPNNKTALVVKDCLSMVMPEGVINHD
ncbi:LytTR family transcriptional regulator [Bacillus altitudinis]|uniref:LytR/AlgR family response regulator transcription factor n=1 Tax=Bacillus altitudinis TaxID=293387 RepID=UPI0020A79E5C|nr:LytTR family DNA-binding domain-containing protein [Bacillus altitudinis]USY51199.1 LytTR family transcriptional regulator [Bacillus altitudinis]